MNDNVETGTRFGLALEILVSKSLERAKFDAKQAWQYSPLCLTPDFSIPSTDKPHFIMEVTQVEARNVFQRKLLRYAQAVSDAKSFFGPSIRAVNVLFGDTSLLPSSSVEVLTSIFDINIFPVTPSHDDFLPSVAGYMGAVLKLVKAGESLADHEFPATVLNDFANLLKRKLKENSSPGPLNEMWAAEYERLREHKTANQKTGATTYYREALLQSLCISNGVYKLIKSGATRQEQDEDTLDLLKSHGVIDIRNSIKGLQIVAPATLQGLVGQQTFDLMRGACSAQVNSIASTRWHFEDIQDLERLRIMARFVTNLLSQGISEFHEALIENARTGSIGGIEHTRCWMADVVAEILAVSHNTINNWILTSPLYKGTIPNPFNNLTMRSERFLGSEIEITTACAALTQIVRDANLPPIRNRSKIVDGLLRLRLYAAKGMQKFNPLIVGLAAIAKQKGYDQASVRRLESCLNDLVEDNGAVGKFDLMEFLDTKSKKRFYLTAIAVGPNYSSDHKADEWSARRRMFAYRVIKGKCAKAELPKTVFVYDGNWSPKSVNKLLMAGWDYVCSVSEFPDLLDTI
jgi:hypothetical protein